MARRLLSVALGLCILFICYGEGNGSHTELQRAKVVPVLTAGPGAMQEDEAAVLGLELKHQNTEIMLMNSGSRLRRYADKKKKKHNAGAFSPLSDAKKTHKSRSKRQGLAKTKLVKQLLKQHESHHERTSPTKKNKAPKRKHGQKSPHQPGTYSVLSYSAQDKERSAGEKEDLDD